MEKEEEEEEEEGEPCSPPLEDAKAAISASGREPSREPSHAGTLDLASRTEKSLSFKALSLWYTAVSANLRHGGRKLLCLLPHAALHW